MPFKKLLYTVFLLLIVAFPLYAQTPEPPDDEFDIFLLLVGMTIVMVMIGIVIAGVLTVLGIIGILAGLVAAGILSASIFAGIVTKSWSKGVKSFFYLFFTVLSAIIGTALMWGVAFIHHWERDVIWAGAIGGALGGLLLARLIIFILQRLKQRVAGAL